MQSGFRGERLRWSSRRSHRERGGERRGGEERGGAAWVYCGFIEAEMLDQQVGRRSAMLAECDAVSFMCRSREFARALGALVAEEGRGRRAARAASQRRRRQLCSARRSGGRRFITGRSSMATISTGRWRARRRPSSLGCGASWSPRGPGPAGCRPARLDATERPRREIGRALSCRAASTTSGRGEGRFARLGRQAGGAVRPGARSWDGGWPRAPQTSTRIRSRGRRLTRRTGNRAGTPPRRSGARGRSYDSSAPPTAAGVAGCA